MGLGPEGVGLRGENPARRQPVQHRRAGVSTVREQVGLTVAEADHRQGGLVKQSLANGREQGGVARVGDHPRAVRREESTNLLDIEIPRVSGDGCKQDEALGFGEAPEIVCRSIRLVLNSHRLTSRSRWRCGEGQK